MRLTFGLSIFTLAIVTIRVSGHDSKEANEQKLAEYLYKKYPKKWGESGRPGNALEPTEVRFTLLLSEILNHADNTVSFGVFLLMKWFDPNLKWSRKEWDGISVITLQPEDIWHPDIIIWNDYLSRFNVLVKDAESVGVWAYHDGEVVWNPLETYRVQCTKKYYKNDTYVKKSCTLTFGSWTYLTDRMDIVFDPETGPRWNLDEMTSFPGITILDSSVERVVSNNIEPFQNSYYWNLNYNIVLGIDLKVNEPLSV